MGKINIALLAGGWSGEREISLRSGDNVFKTLNKKKYFVTMYDPRNDLEKLIKEREKIDLVFILLHGKFGEDGCIQGFLNLLGLPFIGSDVLSSAMAMNKNVAKEMYKKTGLNVIKDIVINRHQDFSAEQIMMKIKPPMLVKPVTEGSSLGISVCHSEKELLKGINLAFQYDQEVMVEQYIKGREITCCVIGNRPVQTLPLIEIMPGQGHIFFDYKAKYTPGAVKEICPAKVSASIAEEAKYCAIKAHKALNCRIWSRSDMILLDEKIYILETNTIPGMTETSLVPLAAKAAGISLPQILDRLISLSLESADSR